MDNLALGWSIEILPNMNMAIGSKVGSKVGSKLQLRPLGYLVSADLYMLSLVPWFLSGVVRRCSVYWYIA